MIRSFLTLVIVCSVVALSCATANATHWAFRQAQFTHHPATGERVTQYAEPEPAYAPVDPTYRQSGHIWQSVRIRSQNGGTDQIRLLDRWGEGGFHFRPF